VSKYHSTLSRREFLKAVGFGGAGLAAASIAPPVFRDLDEVMASPKALMKRPSWVKTVEKPTIEVDWKIIKRFSAWEHMWRGGYNKAVGQEMATLAASTGGATVKKFREDNRPGFLLKDFALGQCSHAAPVSFLGPRNSPTPEALGAPRYEGTPEENAKLVRAFLRLHGCYHVGFVEFNTETTEKLINAIDSGTKPAPGPRIDILDVDQPEDNPDKGYRVLPKKARWAIVYTIQMSPEIVRRAGTMISARNSPFVYDTRSLIQGQLQNFLRTLGYMGLGDSVTSAAFTVNPGLGAMAGIGEPSRIMALTTPELGPLQRFFTCITDLPLAPGKPIDFGVARFCRTCKKCAELCPAKAIPLATEPTWEVQGPYQRPGVRNWYRNEVRCRTYMFQVGACALCFAACPYANYGKADYSDVWRSVAAKTPVFNKAIRKMDDALGLGRIPTSAIEQIWELDLPPYGRYPGND
jgi:epoxyqueuosine reductase